MSTAEQNFSRWLRRNKLQDCHPVRVENTLGAGMPDINICVPTGAGLGEVGNEVWIETKCGSVPLLRPYQFSWGMTRARVGGQVWVLSLTLGGIISGWRYPFHVQQRGQYLEISSLPNFCTAKKEFHIGLLH